MKQIKKVLAVVIVLVLSISMIPATNVSAESKVKLNKKKATIYVGKTVQLKLKNNKKKVKWSSSNKKVATVSKKGKVKGKKAGKATITAKVGKKKYKCKITVKKKVVKKPVVSTTQQPTTKQVTPTEVVGASIVKQNKAEVSFMWSQNTTQANAGQSYKVYIDGVFYNQYPMPTTIAYKFTSAGSHTIRITGVLNGLETIGVTLNVSVIDLGGTGGNTTTEQSTTQAPTTEKPTTDDYGDDGADWIVEGSSTKVYIKEYIGTDTNVVIPSKIQGKEVVGIREGAFNNSNLTSVTISGSITSIGSGIFSDNYSLTSITILNGVTSIEDGAFMRCSNLISITIPSSVTSIGEDAFLDCYILKDKFINNSNLKPVKNCFYGVTLCDSIQNGLYISDKILVKVDSEVTNVTIPNGVTSIGERAFYYCSRLTNVTIPSSVTSIELYAFYRCSSLSSITIPSSVTSIGYGAFEGTGLTSITIPNNVTRIEENAFSWSGLTSITIPNSVTSIGAYAFQSCIGLTSITIPSSVTSIDEKAFDMCYNLQSIKGTKGSYAEAYANENGLTFIAQ